jgi:serine/threonine-protein kinase
MSEREPAASLPRTSIGPYRIVRELGRGGMGIVYEALHEHLRRRVAIKLMRPELLAERLQVERFVREGRAACNIHHPHVVSVYEFDFVDGAPYLVMDYLEGETLAERLLARGHLPLPELLATLLPVLSAVAAAHAAGIVHRDLKPSNIMLARLGTGRELPKVVDFGTSKLLAEPALTHSAALLGTPYYMAPEQARASSQVDARSDQYALGVILYECSTGFRPFEAEGAYAVIHAIMSLPVARPSSLRPERGLPDGFDDVVLRAMAREPAQRFADVRALGAALLRFAPLELAEAWKSEFAGGDAFAPTLAAPVAAPATATLPDVARAPLRTKRTLRAGRLMLAGSVLTALGLLAARLSSRDTSDRPRAGAPTAERAEPLPEPRAEPEREPWAEAPSSARPVPVADAALPEPLQPRAATLDPAAPRPAKRQARPRANPAPAAVTLGDNGAPILE